MTRGGSTGGGKTSVYQVIEEKNFHAKGEEVESRNKENSGGIGC